MSRATPADPFVRSRPSLSLIDRLRCAPVTPLEPLTITIAKYVAAVRWVLVQLMQMQNRLSLGRVVGRLTSQKFSAVALNAKS